MSTVILELLNASALFAGKGMFALGGRALVSTRRPRLIRRRTIHWPNMREAIRLARGIE